MSENLFSKPCRPGILSRFFALLSRIMHWGCCAYLALQALFLLTFFLKPMLLNHDTWSEKTKTMLEKKCRLEVPDTLEWHSFAWRHSFRDEHISGEFTGSLSELECFFPPKRFLWQEIRDPEQEQTIHLRFPNVPHWEQEREKAVFVISGQENDIPLSALAVLPVSENVPEELSPESPLRIRFLILYGCSRTNTHGAAFSGSGP